MSLQALISNPHYKQEKTMSRTTCFLFLLLVTSLSNHHFVSPYPTHHHHQVLLDVSASLRQARQVLSHTQQLQQPPPPIPNGNHSYIITLHPRSSLLGHHHHNNYTTLTLTRLARDAKRVDSILRRHGSLLSSSALEAPVISGADQGIGEYFASIGIGRPVRPAYMVIDTGSDVNWLQCRPCIHCYKQSHPIFNPSSSSTYKRLSCGSRQCGALDRHYCRAGTCVYEVAYGDGSHTMGDLATETITFGSPGQSVPGVTIGCGHTNEGLFAAADGLLGLGGGSLSLPSQIKASSFSYCLVDRDSTSSSTLEFNSTRPQDSVLAPMLKNPRLDDTFHYVALTGVDVGGRPVNIPARIFDVGTTGRGGVIVDSGTTITRFRWEVYRPVRDTFREMSESENLPFLARGFEPFDTCYDLSGLSTVKFPAVAFRFAGGGALQLEAANYLIPVDDSGTFCFAFAPTNDDLSIIGNVQQQGMRVSYDLANNYIGFSPNKC